jgi:hypothetical protein
VREFFEQHARLWAREVDLHARVFEKDPHWSCGPALGRRCRLIFSASA